MRAPEKLQGRLIGIKDIENSTMITSTEIMRSTSDGVSLKRSNYDFGIRNARSATIPNDVRTLPLIPD